MKQSQALRVLVVDDDRDTVESFADILRAMGHAAAMALTPDAAIELAQSERPDVVFVDIGMPGMDGWELAGRLRSLGGHRLRLIAVTGRGEPEDHVRSRRAGFDAHVAKPLDPELVERMLEQMDGWID